MFSKLPVAIASASVLSVQARTVKQQHVAAPKKWPQEIDDEWTSHPNFPEGPYGDANAIKSGKELKYGAHAQISSRWPQAIDDEWTSHPNFPAGPYGNAHEGFAQLSWPQAIDDEWTSHPNFPAGPYGDAHASLAQRERRWPQEIDSEWTSHPNFPSGPYGDAHEGLAQRNRKWGQEIDDEWTSHPNFPAGPYGDAHEGFAQVASKPSKHGKKQDTPEYVNSWDPHPNFPTGPYGPADDLHNGVGPSYPYPAGDIPENQISSAGSPSYGEDALSQKTKAPAKKSNKKHTFAQKPMKSDPNCTSLGCLHDTNDPFNRVTDPGYPVDYPVPNLGMDHDIEHSIKHMNDLEEEHGTWTLPPTPPGAAAQTRSVPACTSNGCQNDTVDPYTRTTPSDYPIDYKVNDLGIDHDVKHSMKSMSDAEGQLGHKWELPAALAQLQSDPIVGTADEYAPHLSAHREMETWPVDYPVPSFGLDEDVAGTQKAEAAASEKLGHTWNPEWDPEANGFAGAYIVPAEGRDFNLRRIQADPYAELQHHSGFLQLEVESDPHLQTYGTKAAGDDRYALDRHFTGEGTTDVEEQAQYNFAPSLDHDVVETQANIVAQEGALIGGRSFDHNLV